MDDCIFCKIAAGEIPSKKAYENDVCYAFYDIAPQAKIHVLVIPKKHISSLDDIDEKNGHIAAKMLETVPQIAKELGISGNYRLVSNCGASVGQSVMHLHFHILSGGISSQRIV